MVENLLSEAEVAVAEVTKIIKNMTALLEIKRNRYNVYKRNEFTVL